MKGIQTFLRKNIEYTKKFYRSATVHNKRCFMFYTYLFNILVMQNVAIKKDASTEISSVATEVKERHNVMTDN